MEQTTWDVTKFMAVAGQQIGDKFAPEVPKPAQWLRQQLLDARFGLKTATDQLRYSALTVRDVAPRDELMALRARLMTEELGELLEAMAEGNTVDVADGLADLIYVVVGAAVTWGIDLPAVWAEVQRANMAKFPLCAACTGEGCDECEGHGRVVLRDAQGKVLKPEGWTPPDVQGVIDRQWLGGVQVAHIVLQGQMINNMPVVVDPEVPASVAVREGQEVGRIENIGQLDLDLKPKPAAE